MLLPLLMNLGMFSALPPVLTQVLGGLSRVVQLTKASAETARVEFDFVSRLAPGERIESALVKISIYKGTVLSLLAQGSAAVAGTKITQKLTGGDPSTVYLLECTAVTSEGLQPYLTSYLTVR